MNISLEDSEELEIEEKLEKSNETQYMSASILIMFLLMIINAIVCRIVKDSKKKSRPGSKYVQETVLTTLIGILAGAFLSSVGLNGELNVIKSAYEQFFMIVLLPPIIFDSAVNMDKKNFFNQLGGIFVLAVFGTITAIIITALSLYGVASLGLAKGFGLLQCLAFGALVSSTDPVSTLSIFRQMNADKTLYALIFGESILNDAVTVVFYRTVANTYIQKEELNLLPAVGSFLIIFFGSITLGFLIGIVCAWILRTYFSSQAEASEMQEDTETLIGLIIPWCSYLVGEGLGLSGIVTIMFCGISMAKYAIPNLSHSGKKLSRKIYHTLGDSFETMAFLFIGLGFFSFDFSFAQMGIALFIVVFIIINVARFTQIKLFSSLLNCFREHGKISKNFQYVMIYSGFRGAMAFALAINANLIFTEHRVGNIMLFITLLYSAITIFIFGTLLVPVLEHFEVNHKENEVIKKNEDYCFDMVKNQMKKIDRKISHCVLRDHITLSKFDSPMAADRLLDVEKLNSSEYADLTKKSVELGKYTPFSPLSGARSPGGRKIFEHYEPNQPMDIPHQISAVKISEQQRPSPGEDFNSPKGMAQSMARDE